MSVAALAMTARLHAAVHDYLFPGDGLEAAGLLLCNRGACGGRQRLLAAEFVCLPHEFSRRERRFVSWPFDRHMTPARIGDVDRLGQSIIAVHSHPQGCPGFSQRDDENDRELFSSVNGWFDDGRPHGSAVMTPDGAITARIVEGDGRFSIVDTVSVVGADIRLWKKHKSGPQTAYRQKLSQTFGKGTLDRLRSLRAGVVGCSGTGSIVIELLARNCVGQLVVVDNDAVEEKNLNRIVNGTMRDALRARPKAMVLQEAIERTGLDTAVEAHVALTDSPEAVSALASCDAIFGCVDSAFGRYHLDCLASAYLIPYFDVGVHIEADSEGGIEAADAVAHYVHPEGSSLLSRGAYTMEQVTAENWQRTDPEYYRRQRVAGYLANVGEEQPAVMSINMQAASMAVNDFMARIHGYRFDPNAEFGSQRLRLVHGCYEAEPDQGPPHPLLARYMGAGDASLLVRNNTRRD